MSRGSRRSGPSHALVSVYERFGRMLANGIPEKESSDLGRDQAGSGGTAAAPQNQSRPVSKAGQTDQVAVLAGVFGAAACAFSWARFSSHSAFFLARRSRLRRAVRGSCGLPIVGGCLAEVFHDVADNSYSRPRKRARARARARKSPCISERLLCTGARELPRGDPKSQKEREARGSGTSTGTGTSTGQKRAEIRPSVRRVFPVMSRAWERRSRPAFRPFRAASRRSS